MAIYYGFSAPYTLKYIQTKKGILHGVSQWFTDYRIEMIGNVDLNIEKSKC